MSKKQDQLDLHRYTVDEALALTDKFLRDSYRNKLLRVWIIHGKGSGVLRQEVRQYLSCHSLVKRWTVADPDRGGDGAVRVELI